MAKITKEEYNKVKNAVNNAYTKESLDNYTKAYNEAMSSGKSSKEAYASASGLLQKNTASSGNTGGSSSNTNASGDVYGDVSGVRGDKVATKDYSNYTKQDLGDLSKFGASAREMEKANSGSISKRNDIIAGNLYTDKTTSEEDIRKYLEGQAGFTDAEKREQDNTVSAIKARLEEMARESSNEMAKTEKVEEKNGKPGYYNTKDGEQKIYGYDEMDDETKNLLDRLDDSQKKYVSNLWASGMQEDLKYYLDTMRVKDQAAARQGINQELYDINREGNIIQAEQTIRNAEESYNNLKQNWQYLGNMGMPGVSSTKLQAIGDALTEAKTTLGEVKRLTQLSLDAQEKQWEGEVLQYNQQIDNLMYDLKWKVGDEITNALSKYTTAELEGKLDTIDGITAFRKELLDELDNNLSGLTSASLTQMQWINQQYQDVANKMYDYAQNANKVNTEMSTVRGFYVDGNGNPILNDQGQPIQVPQNPPMEPIFDKEMGRLITFGLDENGQIVASVQQVYEGDTSNMQGTIVSLLENGVSVQDILKYVPNVDMDTVVSLSKIVKPLYGEDGRPLTRGGGKYTAISGEQLKQGYSNFLSKYTKLNEKGQRVLKSKDIHGGQCGSFVNDYLNSLGLPRLIGSLTEDKEKCINSYEAKVGSVVIMDSPTKPQNGHVGIVTGIDKNGNLTILQSNNKGNDEKVFVSKSNIDKVKGFFDPTKSIESYNNEMKGINTEGTELQTYNKDFVSDYKTFLNGGINAFTKATQSQLEGIFGSIDNFVANANAYKREVDKEVGDVALTMVDNMIDILAWLDSGDGSMGGLRLPMPGSKAYDMKKKYNQVKSSSALQKLIDLKKDGATFGALSDNELGFITDAADWFDVWDSEEAFKGELQNKINKILQKSGMTVEQYKARRGMTTGGSKSGGENKDTSGGGKSFTNVGGGSSSGEGIIQGRGGW